LIDLVKLQKQVWNNTVRMGYTINKKTTIKKLKEELKEFKLSRVIPNFRAEHLSNIKNNSDFVFNFECHVKHSEHDEIPDMFFVLLSYCEQNNIDFETLVMNKLKYNKYRD
jgi:hypothetical protein